MTNLPMRQLKAPLLDSRRMIDDGYGRWSQAIASDDLATALAAVERLEAMDRPAELVIPELLEMRIWGVTALMRAGRPRDAQRLLCFIEARHGQTDVTRLLQARLYYFSGDLTSCASTCSQALALVPQIEASNAQQGVIVRLWADALCLSGEAAKARTILERSFPDRDAWTTHEVRALRQTVVSVDDLDDFLSRLAPLFVGGGARSRMALYHYSMACRDLRQYERAIAAIRHRFLLHAPTARFGSNKAAPAAKPGWVKEARTALLDLQSVFDAANVQLFLISGTLLGCVRENDILTHDKDIDVGVMEEPGMDKAALCRALSGSGKFAVKPYQLDTLLRLQHANGVLIDVFWHRREGELIIHEGLKSKWWNSSFDLVETEFLGRKFLIPEKHDRYLAENYGEWKNPDPSFETFLSTPNMIVTVKEEIVWYYYYKLLDYYISGKSAQFGKIAAALQRERPDDHQTYAVIAEVLAAINDEARGET